MIHGIGYHSIQITEIMECRQTKVSSFNCAGFKGKCEYINKTVYAGCDILLLQETWLHKFEFNIFNEKIKNC